MNSPLRIGIDCDGVLSDTMPAWVRFFNRADHPHDNINALINSDKWESPEVICPNCFQGILNDYDATLDCDVFPDTSRYVQSLAALADLVFISHRLPSVEQATHDWLALHQIDTCFDKFLFGHQNKAVAAFFECLSYHIDDSPNVAKDFHELDIHLRTKKVPEDRIPKLLLIDRPYNQHSSCYIRFPNLAGPGGAAEFLLATLAEAAASATNIADAA